MNNINKWICLCAATCITTFAIAQEEADTTFVDRDVRIEKEYQPEVFESRRLSIELPTAELPNTKSEVLFSNYSNELSLQSPFVPTTQSEMNIMNRKEPKSGFARVGFGLPVMWLADLWYPIIRKRNDEFTFGLNHNGLVGKGQKNIVTDIDLNYQHNFDQLKLYTFLGYGNQFYNFYGADSLQGTQNYAIRDTMSIQGDSIFKTEELINRIRFGIGIISNETGSDWRYSLGLGYNMCYLQRTGIGEHQMLVDGNFEGPVGSHALRIGIDINTLFYSLRENPMMERKVTNAVFGLKPAYLMNWKDGSLQIGLKAYISTSTGRIINVMPDIKGVYNMGKNAQVYAGIGGDYRINSLSELLSENRFYNPYLTTINNTYSPLDLYAGVNIKPMNGLLIDAYLSYSCQLDDYYFMNQGFYPISTTGIIDSAAIAYSNRFTATNINNWQFQIGIRGSYIHKDIAKVYVEGQYNGYYNSKIENFIMPYRPAWRATIGAEWRIIGQLVIDGDFRFISKREVAAVETPLYEQATALAPIYNLNIGAHYTFKNNISLFIRTNNWLSLSKKMRYDNWYGYENIGFHGLVGASFAF